MSSTSWPGLIDLDGGRLGAVLYRSLVIGQPPLLIRCGILTRRLHSALTHVFITVRISDVIFIVESLHSIFDVLCGL